MSLLKTQKNANFFLNQLFREREREREHIDTNSILCVLWLYSLLSFSWIILLYSHSFFY